MQDSDKKLAREYLIKVKVYRMFATLFAMLGLAVVLSLYYKFYDADAVRAMREPMTILIVICPFLPALMFSRKANKAEKQLRKILAPPAEAAKPAAPEPPPESHPGPEPKKVEDAKK